MTSDHTQAGRIVQLTVTEPQEKSLRGGAPVSYIRLERIDSELNRIRVLPLNVPLALARGLYEELTDKQITAHIADMQAELARREEAKE